MMLFGARLYACSAICLLSLIYLTAFSGPTAAQFISEGGSLLHGVGGRSLLQTKTNCPVDFERQNYTILTSQCKGPDYLPKLCCAAFKQFACKFAQYINDLSNECADTMFSYINLHGKYPPGLFANTCKEGKEGLACDAEAPDGSQNDSSGSNAYHSVLNFSVACCILIINLLGVFVA
ncbi:GPI-anchored protein LLG2 [Cryptomeria japonica]|uniref:GPI-anchored protein LLG2 n=1 Tax=Cryptomeria japonica TaxID=3369 RepID=UPI0025AD0815|nr:GPI-anchored protein LLG2 [Cryptomeria japonica]